MPKLGSASLREASFSVVLRAEGVTRRQLHRGREQHSSFSGSTTSRGTGEENGSDLPPNIMKPMLNAHPGCTL